VGALNNEARETNDYGLKIWLRDVFDVALSSCYLGMRKPEAAIYKRRWIFWGAGAAVLFIDDGRRMWLRLLGWG